MFSQGSIISNGKRGPIHNPRERMRGDRTHRKTGDLPVHGEELLDCQPGQSDLMKDRVGQVACIGQKGQP